MYALLKWFLKDDSYHGLNIFFLNHYKSAKVEQ